MAPPRPASYRATASLLDEFGLQTVCRHARCPNMAECFSAGTATFLILGATCTRSCRFCAIGSAAPERPPTRRGQGPPPGASSRVGDCTGESARVAMAVRSLALRHVVVTSVTRDDLPDGGAGAFADTIRAIRDTSPSVSIEVLIPDFGGDQVALDIVLAARPNVLAHNLETVPRLSPLVRPQADFGRSSRLLASAVATGGSMRGMPVDEGSPHPFLVKTGFMVGLGERDDEVLRALELCAATGVGAVTIGQYLQPNERCLPVARYVRPDVFAEYRARGEDLGLSVMAGPLVRSSYHAAELAAGEADPLRPALPPA